MIKYPLHFSSLSKSSSGIDSVWQTQAGNLTSALAIPPEFQGPGGGLSPEDLYCQALTNCFIATFKVYAQMSKLQFNSVSADSILTVDLDENKKPVMKSLEVRVQIKDPANPDKAILLAERAAKSGFILNSVKTKCSFHFDII